MTWFDFWAVVVLLSVLAVMLALHAALMWNREKYPKPDLGDVRIAVLDNGKFRVERYELDGYNDEYGDGAWWKPHGTFTSEDDAKEVAEAIKDADQFAKVTGFLPINEANGTR